MQQDIENDEDLNFNNQTFANLKTPAVLREKYLEEVKVAEEAKAHQRELDAHSADPNKQGRLTASLVAAFMQLLSKQYVSSKDRDGFEIRHTWEGASKEVSIETRAETIKRLRESIKATGWSVRDGGITEAFRTTPSIPYLPSETVIDSTWKIEIYPSVELE